jgi:hypothetical protein
MRSLVVALVLLMAPLLSRESAAAAPAVRPETAAEATPGTAEAARPKAGSRHHRKKAAARVSARLVRSGFHLTPHGSEVVLQTSAEVELRTHESKSGPTFVLKRCRATRANDRRPLDTRFFATSVTHVALRQRGADLEVRVRLKDAATATPRKETGPGETWSWILEFADPESGGRAPAAPPARKSTDVPTATAAATPSIVD